jgi:hypothetical protein
MSKLIASLLQLTGRPPEQQWCRGDPAMDPAIRPRLVARSTHRTPTGELGRFSPLPLPADGDVRKHAARVNCVGNQPHRTCVNE